MNNCIDTIFRKIIKKFFGKKFSEKDINNIIQFLKFGIVGLSNTIVSYLVYVIAVMIFQVFDIFQNSNYIVGNTIAFIVGVLWSFFWNQKYVFTMEKRDLKSMFLALMKTYATYFFSSWVLSNILSAIWIELLGCPVLIAPLINLIVTIPVNFLLNKFWAFK